MNNLSLIPEPQIIEKLEGYFIIPDAVWNIAIEETDLTTLWNNSKDILPNHRIIEELNDVDLLLETRAGLSFPDTIHDDLLDQSYQLSITSKRIELLATTPTGIFYGLQTLRQIINQSNGRIPSMRIIDWPNMPFRGVHLTLGSGHMPTFEKLKELIVNFSRCKINNFVFEYDDRFPWEKHPIIVHPDALTKDQIRELIVYAKKYFIEIIPLLDSLGHAQAYLKHNEYQHLAELPGNRDEMCPSNPNTLTFIKELWSEILDVHKDCKFAHISGDEVFRLGKFCPNCQTFAENNQLSDLFCNYYKDLSEWIIEQGRRPIIWADMLLKYPEKISILPKEVILNDWEYRGSSSEWTVTRMLNVRGLTLDKDNLEMIPSEHRDYFNKYYLNKDKTTFKPYPGIETLKDYGFEVIGSSSSSTESGMNITSPPFSTSINNNKYMSKAIVSAKALGLLNTFWSSTHDIIASMHGIWAGGAYSWKFSEEKISDFLDKCEITMMNSNTGMLSKYANVMDGYNLPKPGTFTPILNNKCPTLNAFPLPLCNDSNDPIVQNYLLNLKNNALDMITIQQSFALTRKELPHDFGKGNDLFIDLTKKMNANHASVIHLTGRNFTPMGIGKKICRGIKFNIVDPNQNKNKSALGLRSPYRPNWHKTAKIDIHNRFEQLFFLNSCAYTPSGEIPAICKIHYIDGSIEKYNFEIGKNIGDWNKANFKLSTGFPAFTWYSYDDAGTLQSSYMSWWNNPSPEKEILHLQLCSGDSDGYLFFFAITGRNREKNK